MGIEEISFERITDDLDSDVARAFRDWNEKVQSLVRPLLVGESNVVFLRPLEFKEEGFVVELAGVGILGFGLIAIDQENRRAALAVQLDSDEYWKTSYGADVVRRLLSLAFDLRELHRVSVALVEPKPWELECYENIGFRREGVLRQAVKTLAGYDDIAVFGLLSGEFRP